MFSPTLLAGQFRCDFGWETAVNVGYAAPGAAATRAALVRVIEQNMTNALCFSVYAAVDRGGDLEAGVH